jgi:hypothetical protein
MMKYKDYECMAGVAVLSGLESSAIIEGNEAFAAHKGRGTSVLQLTVSFEHK